MRWFVKVVFAISALAVLAGKAEAQFNLSTNNLSFSANAGTSAGSQQVTLFNLTTNPLTIHFSLTGPRIGLSASIDQDPVAGNGQATITVTVNSSTVQPGNYDDTLTVSDNNGNSQAIDVSLSVSGVTISAPFSLTYSLVAGNRTTVMVQVSGGPATVLISAAGSFLSADPSVQAPGKFSLTIDASSLSPGPNMGSLTFQCAGGGSPCVPVVTSVTVNVLPATSLLASINALTFQAYQGRSDPPPQSLQLRSSDGSQLAFTLNTDQPWLVVSATGNTASSVPVLLRVSVSAAGLSLGMNSGTITAQPSNGAPTVTITVTATLSAFSILVTPNPPLSVTVGVGRTRSVPLQIGSVDGNAVGVAITEETDQGGDWLQAPASLNAPGQLNVTIDATKLTLGNYTGSLTLSCTTATCVTVKIAITLSVTTFATINANPTSLSFEPGPNSSLPGSQTVSLTASDQSSQSFSFSFVPQGSWLNVTANQSNTPATLTVSVVSIPAPNSTGTITITPANGAPVISIAVTFGATPAIQAGGIITASSFGGFSSITSGTYLEVYGSHLSSTTREWGGSDFHNGRAPIMLDDVSATLNGQAMFVRFISPGQVNLVVPDNIGTGPGQLVLTNSMGSTPPYTVDIKAEEPGLLAPLAFLIGGKQYIGATFADGSFVLPTGAVPGVKGRPAKPKETVVFFGLGFGEVDPNVPAGTITPQLTKLHNPLEILFGQSPATLTYEGLVPPYVGLYQFNVVVPDVPDSDAVRITFNLAGVPGTQTLYIAVHH